MSERSRWIKTAGKYVECRYGGGIACGCSPANRCEPPVEPGQPPRPPHVHVHKECPECKEAERARIRRIVEDDRHLGRIQKNYLLAAIDGGNDA